MASIILLFFIGIILIVCSMLILNHTEQDEIGISACVIGIILIISGIITSCTLINRKARWNYEIETYYNVKSIAESYDNIDKDRIEAFNLMDVVLAVNNNISEHKTHCHSPWTGVWYSEEIGNLPKIELKKVE